MKLYKFCLIIPIIMAASCAMFKTVININVSAASKQFFPEIKTISILDFQTTAGYEKLSSLMAKGLEKLITTDNRYEVKDSYNVKKYLSDNRLSPSRLQEKTVLYHIGRETGVDSLIFGDLSDIKIEKEKKIVEKRKRIGETLVEKIITDTKGNTKTGMEYEPLFKQYNQTVVDWTIRLNMKLRLVETGYGKTLWENEGVSEKTYRGTNDEVNGEQGYWMSENEMLSSVINRMANHLIEPLLEKKVHRDRLLASFPGNSQYSQLIGQGNKLATRGKWSDAEKKWRKAMTMDKLRPEAYANLGIFMERKGEYKQAIDYYEYAGKELGNPWQSYKYDIIKYRKMK